MAVVYDYRYWDTGLHNGDCMNQKQFHHLYERTPEGFRAELIDGVVFISEPSGEDHGFFDLRVGSILDAYQAATPGSHAAGNVTVMLSEEDEVQPDLFLRILPSFQGQSRDSVGGKKKYVQGAPELVAEIAHSTRSIDLHKKRARYALAGAVEYIVVCLEPLNLHWFNLRSGEEWAPDSDGFFRSVVFPGLWIDAAALLQMDYRGVMDALEVGLKSKEHSDFVKKLKKGQR